MTTYYRGVAAGWQLSRSHYAAPTLLIINAGRADLARMEANAAALGFEVRGPVPLAEAEERLDRQISIDCVWAVLDGDAEALEERLLARLDRAAREGTHASLVSIAAGRIDWAFALAPHPLVQLLRDAQPHEEASALASIDAAVASRLHEAARTEPIPQLRQLSEETGRIAAALAMLSELEPLPPQGMSPGSEALSAATIRAMIRARRLRERFFREGLFADPAWDMLLDLMAARLEGQQITVSSLCIAAAVPSTTALRWIKALTEAGLFVRRDDPQDRRRVYIDLSEDAAERFGAYLQAAQKFVPLTV